MSKHPVNLAFRFVLELGAWLAMGYWGWAGHQGLSRFFWMIGTPLASMVLWGTFAVPDDPSRSGKAPVPTPGSLRLLLELATFAVGVWCSFAAGQAAWGWVLGIGVLLHYALSYDRIVWLVRQ